MLCDTRCAFCCVRKTTCSLQRKPGLSALAKQLDFRKGGIVYSAGMPARAVFVVRTGSVRLTADDSWGGSRIVRFAEAGDIFGVDSLLPSAVYAFTATAREPSTICLLNPELLRRLADEDVGVVWRLVVVFARLLQDTELGKAEISGQPVRDRLIAVKRRLQARPDVTAWRAGTAAPCHRMAEVAQWELARLLGVSEETVSRELAKLRVNRTMAVGGARAGLRSS